MHFARRVHALPGLAALRRLTAVWAGKVSSPTRTTQSAIPMNRSSLPCNQGSSRSCCRVGRCIHFRLMLNTEIQLWQAVNRTDKHSARTTENCLPAPWIRYQDPWIPCMRIPTQLTHLLAQPLACSRFGRHLRLQAIPFSCLPPASPRVRVRPPPRPPFPPPARRRSPSRERKLQRMRMTQPCFSHRLLIIDSVPV